MFYPVSRCRVVPRRRPGSRPIREFNGGGGDGGFGVPYTCPDRVNAKVPRQRPRRETGGGGDMDLDNGGFPVSRPIERWVREPVSIPSRRGNPTYTVLDGFEDGFLGGYEFRHGFEKSRVVVEWGDRMGVEEGGVRDVVHAIEPCLKKRQSLMVGHPLCAWVYPSGQYPRYSHGSLLFNAVDLDNFHAMVFDVGNNYLHVVRVVDGDVDDVVVSYSIGDVDGERWWWLEAWWISRDKVVCRLMDSRLSRPVASVEVGLNVITRDDGGLARRWGFALSPFGKIDQISSTNRKYSFIPELVR